MSDIIQLLPDSIANQIAAGEVIQRPASVVKELMENSIDAGATEITLVLKEAGKVLIQVSDNGKGMSSTDARMCFERHATSKIKNANDIFQIKTKGFRGEALASIAAISHVELVTKQLDDEIGAKVILVGSKFKKQEQTQSEKGTKISVKNLFFNVPARRKFLKSDSVELKHINDEFIRLALAHTDVMFSFFHNGKELYRLPKSNLKTRILGLFGRGYDSKILAITEDTELLEISGYIGKIEAARKSRANQFFFVNNRFIKSNYLNHAINSTYEEYIQEGTYPMFFVFLEIDPDRIDINIHPTKQEIKFEDERLIYNYIKVSVKHVLAKHTYSPSLDFDTDSTFSSMMNQRKTETTQNKYKGFTNAPIKPNKNRDDWEKAFDIIKKDTNIEQDFVSKEIPSSLNTLRNDELNEKDKITESVYQIHNSYILKQVKSGFILIDQRLAHKRVLYEEFLKIYENKANNSTEQLLFPHKIEIDKSKKNFLKNVVEDLAKFGFLIDLSDEEDILIKGIPTNMVNKKQLYQILEDVVEDLMDGIRMDFNFAEKFSIKLADINAYSRGAGMTQDEMSYLVEELFKCSNPYTDPNGKKCFVKIEMEEIIKRFS